MTQQQALIALAENALEWLESVYRDERISSEDRCAASLLVVEYRGMIYDSVRTKRLRLLADVLARPAEWLAAVRRELHNRLTT